jgi:hypothetical protein
VGECRLYDYFFFLDIVLFHPEYMINAIAELPEYHPSTITSYVRVVHNANNLTTFLGRSICAAVLAQCGPERQDRTLVDGDLETSQPCQETTEQCHTAYKMSDGDSVLATCYLDSVLHDVSESARLGASKG